MFCPNCGASLPDSAMFCAHCGTRVGQPYAPQPLEGPQPQQASQDPPLDATIARPVAAPAAAPSAQQPPYAPGYDEDALQGIPSTPKKSNVTPVVVGVIAALVVTGVIVAGFLTNWFGIAGGTFALPGTSDEVIIKRQISSFVETIKSPSQKDIERIGIPSDTLNQLQQYGIDPAEMMRVMLKYLSCKVNSVAVDGDTAVAYVTISNVDYAMVGQSLEAKIQDPTVYNDLLQFYLGGDNEALGTWAIKTIGVCIDENKDNLTSFDTEFEFERHDGTWTISGLDPNELARELFGDLDVNSFF